MLTTQRRIGWLGGALLAVILGPVFIAWTWSGELAGLGGDNAIYLLTARHLSPWMDNSQVAAFFAQRSQYPPLFPFLLGVLGGAGDLHLAHAITAGTLVGAFVAYFFWLRTSGLRPLLAAALTVTFALLPGTYLQALSVHSESTFVLGALTALVALSRRDSDQLCSLTLAAVAVAAAMLTRTIGVSLLIAAVLGCLWSTEWAVNRRRALSNAGLLGCAAIPLLLWHWTHPSSQPGYLHDWVAAVGTVPGQWIHRALAVLAGLADAWHQNLFGSTPGLSVISRALLLVAAAGAMWRAGKGRTDGIYAVIYLAVVLAWTFLWPGTAPRLLWPLVPVLLFHALWMVTLPARRLRRVGWSGYVSAAVIGVLVVGALPSLHTAVQRIAEPIDGSAAPFRRLRIRFMRDPRLARLVLENHAAIIRGLREATAEIPAADCVYAVKPSVVGFYLDRVSYRPPRAGLPGTEFWSELQSTRCRYALTFNFPTPSFPSPLYPAERLAPRARVVSSWSSAARPASAGDLVAVLFEIDWR